MGKWVMSYSKADTMSDTVWHHTGTGAVCVTDGTDPERVDDIADYTFDPARCQLPIELTNGRGINMPTMDGETLPVFPSTVRYVQAAMLRTGAIAREFRFCVPSL